MWTEQTPINPEAWSTTVERDLRRYVLRDSFGIVPKRNEQTGQMETEVRLEDEPPGFTAEFDGAIGSAREQLANVAGPQIVRLAPSGATLEPFPVPSPEERALHESVHESARFAAIQGAALIARINGLRVSNEHQQIEREARMHEWNNAEEANFGAALRAISGGSGSPAFSSTPNVGSGLVSATLDTSLTAPTNITTILTAGASGTQIFQIVLTGVLTTVAGVVNIFRHDGTTYHSYDPVLVAAVTSSTTAVPFRADRQYPNLILKSGDTLRVTNTIAGNQSGIKVTAHGGDL